MNEIKITSLDNDTLKDKLETFLVKNKIDFKYVNDTVYIYPNDYKKIDKSKVSEEGIPFPLFDVIWDEDEDIGAIELDPHYILNDRFITLQEVFNFIITFSTNDNQQYYYSEDDLILLKAKDIEKQRLLEKMRKAEDTFKKELKTLRISENEFLNLLEKYNATLLN